MIDLEDYKDNDIVKSLRDCGLSDEYIAAGIESGDIKIEKSEEKEEEKEIKNLKERKEGLKKKNLPKKKTEKEDFEEEEFSDDDFEDEDEDLEDDDEEGFEEEKEEKEFKKKLEKSLNQTSFAERFDKLEKSVNKIASILSTVAKSAPSFKGADLSASIIEKSRKEEEIGETELNVYTQRQAVRNEIAKAIDIERDDEIKKSLISGSKMYMCDPAAIPSEDVARYLLSKGIRLVK